jgi:predicted TIM-barrel fold metal-dependent hydrolase
MHAALPRTGQRGPHWSAGFACRADDKGDYNRLRGAVGKRFGIPKPVIDKIYYANARRVFGLSPR